jgi:hypothetical protein
MLHINNHEITGIYRGLKDILNVYSGLKLVWSKISESGLLCCYSNGYWIDDYPWIDDNAWAD